MGILTTNLTEREDQFVELLCEGFSPRDAASAAGYPARSYVELLQSPRISRRVEWRMRSVIRGELAPKALRFLGRLLDDETASNHDRRAAAQFILERAGYVAPRAQVAEAAEKSISAMSADELASLVEKLEAERASRAKDVSAPNAQGLDSEATDMLG